jgi:adenylate kinase family enzyme
MITLDQLGKRICIIGCSNSGKSTLADSLSSKLNIPVHHLDQYAYLANSKWKRQSDEILVTKHNEIINQDSWVIDGNYNICMAPRFDLASSIIWLDPSVSSSVFRYVLRSIKNDPNRPGRLAGARREFSFWLIKWIIFNYPKNRLKYSKLIKARPNLLTLNIRSLAELKKYYVFWGF